MSARDRLRWQKRVSEQNKNKSARVAAITNVENWDKREPAFKGIVVDAVCGRTLGSGGSLLRKKITTDAAFKNIVAAS